MKRKPRLPTPERLKNISVFYLGRYAASESSLRRVLEKRVANAARRDPDFAADAAKQGELKKAIEDIVAAHRRTGALNDAALAEIKVASLRRAGRSERFIRQKLAEKGIAKNLTAQALAAHDGEMEEGEAESVAARAFAKRKRLGPYRPKDRVRDAAKEAQKDFAAMARAGYGAGVIRKILRVAYEAGVEE